MRGAPSRSGSRTHRSTNHVPLRLAAAADRAIGGDEQEAALLRVAPPAARHRICKRAPAVPFGALTAAADHARLIARSRPARAGKVAE